MATISDKHEFTEEEKDE